MMIVNIAMTDTRPSQSQCLRDPHASISNEAIGLEHEPSASTAYNKPCSHNFRIANVARTGQTFTAELPSILVWR